MLKSEHFKKNIMIFIIIFTIFILFSLIYGFQNFVINKSDKNPSNNFEYLIKKNDYLNFTVNYDVLLHGSYKDPFVKAPDGNITLWHKEFEKIYSKNIDVQGMHWPKLFIRYEESRWLYDLQEVVEKNHYNFEINYVGKKEYLKEITKCFLIKGSLNNTNILLEHCYNSNGIMLYQNLSAKEGGAELIASSYKLEVD